MNPTRIGRTCAQRRGAALIAGVAALAIVHLMVVGAIAPAGGELETSLLRAQSLRALHAGDSGLVVVLAATRLGTELPAIGELRDLGAASFEVLRAPEDGEPGVVVIEGRSAGARRRLAVDVE